MFRHFRTFSAQDRCFLQYSWDVYALYCPLCSVETNSVFSETHSCSMFWVVVVAAAVGIKEMDISWTFLRPREWQFSICAERIAAPEKASCVRFNRAFVFIFQRFCRLNNSQHRSWMECSAFIPWLVKANVTLWGVLWFPERKTTKWAARGSCIFGNIQMHGQVAWANDSPCFIDTSAWFAL